MGIFLRLQKALRSLYSNRPSLRPPGLDGSLFEGKRRVRDNEIQIDLDGSAESPAGLTGSDRAVEGEEVGEGGPVSDVAVGAVEPVAEGKVLLRLDPDIDPAAAEPKGLLQRIDDPFSIRALEDNRSATTWMCFSPGPLLQGFDLAGS